MTLYSVFDRPDAPTEPVAVPDRFSWLAAILPPVFLLRHGLWLALTGYVAFVVLVAVASVFIGDGAAFWLYVLGMILFGFEAGALRRARLRRTGRTLQGEVIALGADLAEVEWLKASRR